ncbi:MAG: DNA-binding response regulator [Halomonadaceae bacterium]|nr:MAG: DNA-binding response regulator [Halomonadaceae bacterium]
MTVNDVQKDTVLVVDDSLDTIRMINDVLEAAGMTVLVALEGAQALNITRNITPDIILLDALMPNMDGFETCRQLKQNPELGDCPIIFMTGLHDTEHVVMGLSCGSVDYIAKPIVADELLARMQVHLANARMAQSARTALDQTGQFLFAVNPRGKVLWATPQARRRFNQSGLQVPQAWASLENRMGDWLGHRPEAGHHLKPEPGTEGLTMEFLAAISGEEHLLRLVDDNKPADTTARLKAKFAVTQREADVLLWIAHGKTNREIGEILSMSPRTVNKHLEQVFPKLGVENRTAAAAAAIRCLARV